MAGLFQGLLLRLLWQILNYLFRIGVLFVENVEDIIDIGHVISKVFCVLFLTGASILYALLVSIMDFCEGLLVFLGTFSIGFHFVRMVHLGESNVGLFYFLLRAAWVHP